MQTVEYRGFAGQFPIWLRAQVDVWRMPLLLSLLLHVCLFWPQGLSPAAAGRIEAIGPANLNATLKPRAPTDASSVNGPTELLRHATVTQSSSRRMPPLPREPARAIESAPPATRLEVSTGLDAGALRSYRLSLARAMMAGDLHRRLRDPALAGRVEIGVALAANGLVREVVLLHGSGIASLDATVLAAVGAAARETSVPAAMQGRDFVIALPVEVGATDAASSALATTSAAGR